MRLVAGLLLLTALSVGASPAPLEAGHPVQLSADVPVGPDEVATPILTFRDARIVFLVSELERRSPTAARMLRAIRESGLPLVIGSTASVLPDVQAEHHDYDPLRARALGFMAPSVRPAGEGRLRTERVLVGLDLDRVAELFGLAREFPRPSAFTWAEIEELETLALLGHEVVHAYGLVLAGGDPRHGCLDPVDDQAPERACVVLGENLIRQEIGAPLDWGYGLAPLRELPSRYAQVSARRIARRRIAADATRILRSGIGPLD